MRIDADTNDAPRVKPSPADRALDVEIQLHALDVAAEREAVRILGSGVRRLAPIVGRTLPDVRR